MPTMTQPDPVEQTCTHTAGGELPGGELPGGEVTGGEVTGGWTRTATPTLPLSWTSPAGCWGTGSSRPPRPATRGCWVGCVASGRGPVGMEGTGAYGAGLAHHLQTAGVELVEVDRPTARPAGTGASPTRSTPRPPPAPPRPGARSGVPKTRGGPTDALRSLRVARRSAVAAGAQAQTQMKSLIRHRPRHPAHQPARTGQPGTDHPVRHPLLTVVPNADDWAG